jgi:DNA adenine methylase
MALTATRKKKKLIAFGWYGGKFSHLDWLLPLLPITQHYCEPFGGSAAILLNRKPSNVETYNDIDGEIVNFFKVLRDKKEELLYAIGMTPFSREEFREAIKSNGNGEHLSDLERARRFFIRARQVRTGLAQTASNGRWANCLSTSRAGMAGAVSRWLGSVEGLEFIATRLLRVQIENDDALSVIKRYDSADTLFYCDPPYAHESRGDKNAYKYEMTDFEHVHLANLLKNVKGKVAISGYRCDLYNELFKDWKMHVAPTKKALSIKSERTEILWTNY